MPVQLPKYTPTALVFDHTQPCAVHSQKDEEKKEESGEEEEKKEETEEVEEVEYETKMVRPRGTLRH